jgi:hypothetical protein
VTKRKINKRFHKRTSTLRGGCTARVQVLEVIVCETVLGAGPVSGLHHQQQTHEAQSPLRELAHVFLLEGFCEEEMRMSNMFKKTHNEITTIQNFGQPTTDISHHTVSTIS